MDGVDTLRYDVKGLNEDVLIGTTKEGLFMWSIWCNSLWFM